MLELVKSDHIATIRFQRADKMNAFTFAMWRQLAEYLEEIEQSQDIRVVVFTGDGNHFCAGADIGEFDRARDKASRAQTYEEANVAAFSTVRNCPVPTIASIRGNCFGGGFGIAAACDIRLADENARFCVPPAKLGLAYPVEAMADIVHAVGPQIAKLLCFSADVIDARQAFSYGFLAQIHSALDLAGKVDALSARISKNAPLSIRASKAAIIAALTGDPKDRAVAIEQGQKTFDSDDYREGRAAFAERRAPLFTGH